MREKIEIETVGNSRALQLRQERDQTSGEGRRCQRGKEEADNVNEVRSMGINHRRGLRTEQN